LDRKLKIALAVFLIAVILILILTALPPKPPPLTGCGEDYLLDSSVGAPLEAYLERWANLTERFSKWRFNTVRLAFRFPDAPATAKTAVETLDYVKLNSILTLLNQKGVKAILDLHNYKDMYGWFGSDAWIKDWCELASRFKGDNRIVAFELFNEPSSETWAPQVTSKEDVARAFARCTDAIREIDPHRTIVWADPYYYNYTIPPDAIRHNVIYGFHAWKATSDMNEAMNYLNYKLERMKFWKEKYGTIWLGEFGVYGGYDFEVQKAICVGLINWCVDNGVGFCYWLYSRNHWVQGSADEVLAESNYLKFQFPTWLIIPITAITLIVGYLILKKRH
jgi:hypothetical protein